MSSAAYKARVGTKMGGNRATIVTTSIMLVMLKPLRTILVVAFKVPPVVLVRGPPFYIKSRWAVGVVVHGPPF